MGLALLLLEPSMMQMVLPVCGGWVGEEEEENVVLVHFTRYREGGC